MFKNATLQHQSQHSCYCITASVGSSHSAEQQSRRNTSCLYLWYEWGNVRSEFVLECKLIEKTNPIFKATRIQSFANLWGPMLSVLYFLSHTHTQCTPSLLKCNNHFAGDSQAQCGSCQLREALGQLARMGIWLMFYLWKVWEDILYNSTSIQMTLPSACNLKLNIWCGNVQDQSFYVIFPLLVWLVLFYTSLGVMAAYRFNKVKEAVSTVCL